MKTNLMFANRDSAVAARPYVLVNPLLAKHMPAVPGESLSYFDKLASLAANTCGKEEKVLVIGFAETATAVGAVVASAIAGSVFVHTTREPLALELLAADFAEEHSHARQQTLYLKNDLSPISKYDRLCFVEDEITTGRTILNFLNAVNFTGKITVAALVFNGFDMNIFSSYQASFCSLQKTGYLQTLDYRGFSDARLGVDSHYYVRLCDDMAAWLAGTVDLADFLNKRLLVLGTEEFMYQALVVGKRFEKIADSVVTHSTTRSPLLTDNASNYPIYSRFSFASIYDDSRETYLYNLEHYDVVIIVTDAKGSGDSLLNTVRKTACEKIYLVRLYHAHE